jgi:hypothetical protein
MLLFKAIRVNLTKKSFYISFKFLTKEDKAKLTRACEHLR